MSALDYFSLFVLVVLVVLPVALLVFLAAWPGRVARTNDHPHADAINVAGWLGLPLTLGVVWVLAMVWARVLPTEAGEGRVAADLGELKSKVAELERRMDAAREEMP